MIGFLGMVVSMAACSAMGLFLFVYLMSADPVMTVLVLVGIWCLCYPHDWGKKARSGRATADHRR